MAHESNMGASVVTVYVGTLTTPDLRTFQLSFLTNENVLRKWFCHRTTLSLLLLICEKVTIIRTFVIRLQITVCAQASD